MYSGNAENRHLQSYFALFSWGSLSDNARKLALSSNKYCQTVKENFEPITFEIDRARQRQVFYWRIVRSKSAFKNSVKYLRLDLKYLRAEEFKFFLFTQVKSRQVQMSSPRPRMPRYVSVNGVLYLLNNTPSVQSKLIQIL